MSDIERWSDDELDRVQRELAGAETPLYLQTDDVLRVLEAAEAVPPGPHRGAVEAIREHKRALEERFAETGGDPNDADLALWATLDSLGGR